MNTFNIGDKVRTLKGSRDSNNEFDRLKVVAINRKWRDYHLRRLNGGYSSKYF